MSAQPTVLVVEDDVHVAHVLTFMLERQVRVLGRHLARSGIVTRL
jgi:CheY-like chemotaxis protein